MKRIRILSIVGSPRPQSRVKIVVDAIHASLREHGAQSTVWNLGERPLPFLDPDQHALSGAHRVDVLDEYLRQIRDSDGYVLATPIYHNSFSGWLKNAIDQSSSRDVGGKAFGLVSHGGSMSTQAVDQLRLIVRGVHGCAIPTQVCTGECDFTEDIGKGPALMAEQLMPRIGRFCAELLTYTAMLKGLREQAALEPTAS